MYTSERKIKKERTREKEKEREHSDFKKAMTHSFSVIKLIFKKL